MKRRIGLSRRLTTRTRLPACRSRVTTLRPRLPVPPVTKIKLSELIVVTPFVTVIAFDVSCSLMTRPGGKM